MVPTAPTVSVPSEATAVARRYRRFERPVSVGQGVLVAILALVALVRLPLLWGLFVALFLGVLLRAPVFRTGGTARLASPADAASVRADFEGATPPVFALQWGIADEVYTTPEGTVYHTTDLFGLRSVDMRATVEAVGSDDPEGDLELQLRAGDRPWGTYVVSIAETESGTLVDVEWRSDTQFGLRRLPQLLVAERFRPESLVAQGYDVVDRDASVHLLGR